jgi:hypothetical protein
VRLAERVVGGVGRDAVWGNVCFGSKADIGLCPRHVRFTPKSGHWLSASGCPLCAKSGHMHCSN